MRCCPGSLGDPPLSKTPPKKISIPRPPEVERFYVTKNLQTTWHLWGSWYPQLLSCGVGSKVGTSKDTGDAFVGRGETDPSG